jgi:hypothetical protein
MSNVYIQKCYIAARLDETASKIATNGACTNDQNLHDVVLVLSAAVPRIDFTRSAEDDPSSDSP